MKAAARTSTRKFRRLQSPLNASVCGRICRALNWSPAGLFLEIPGSALTQGRLETAELLLPCADGIYSASVTLRPLRETGSGWACDLIDLPPSVQAALVAYADAMIHGFSVTLAELRRATDDPRSHEDFVHLLEEPPHSAWSVFWHRVPLKRILFAAVFLMLIVGVGSLVVPFFVKRFMTRMKEGDGYLEVAQSRIRTGDIALRDLDAKIKTVKSILDPQGGGSHLPISLEQKQMLQLGLDQLENERRMVDVHMDIFRSNLALIRKGNYFFEQSVLHNYGTESHTDPAPYITQILTDIAVSSRIEPHSPDDVKKYLLVAQARVKQAEFELKSSQVQRAALEKILARSTSPRQNGVLPFNSIELIHRDIDLLKLDEERLEEMLAVLRDNVRAVENGNFMYETNLLQRFDPQPLRTATPNDSALTH